MKKISLLLFIFLQLESCTKDEVTKSKTEDCILTELTIQYSDPNEPAVNYSANTIFAFDADNKPTSAIETTTYTNTNQQYVTLINYLYDSKGRLIKVIRDPDNSVTNTIRNITYLGDVISEVSIDESTTKYFHNSVGQLIKVEFHDSLNPNTVGGATFEYESPTTKNPIKSVTNTNGNITGYMELVYDDKKTLKLPGEYSFSENNSIKIVSKDPVGNVVKTFDYYYEYNSQGYPTKIISPVEVGREITAIYSCK